MAHRDGQSTDSQNFAPLVTSKAREDDVRVKKGPTVQRVADDRTNQRLFKKNDDAVVTRSRKGRGGAPTDG